MCVNKRLDDLSYGSFTRILYLSKHVQGIHMGCQDRFCTCSWVSHASQSCYIQHSLVVLKLFPANGGVYLDVLGHVTQDDYASEGIQVVDVGVQSSHSLLPRSR